MLDKAPRACFGVESSLKSSAKEEISRILESGFSARFGTMKQGLLWHRDARFVDVSVGQKSVSVLWHPSKFEEGAWILTVAPDPPSIWDYFRGRTAVVYKEELKLVSRDVHALLVAEQCISKLMWYFNGFREQGRKGVWTPDELPWAEA
jgi:hypothetical protein